MSVELEVSLPESLRRLEDRTDPLREAVAAAVAEVVAALALESSVTARVAWHPDAHAAGVAVSLNGRPCRYPRDLALRAWSRVTAWSSAPRAEAELSTQLAAAPPERCIEWIAILCRDVAWIHRARLLDDDASLAWFVTAEPALQPGLWRSLARTLTALGLDLKDSARADRHIAGEFARGADADTIIETLISARGDTSIELRMSHAYLCELTSSDPAAQQSATFSSVYDALFYDLGWKLPRFRFVADDRLAPRTIVLRCKRIELPAFQGLAPGERALDREPAPGERAALHPARSRAVAVVAAPAGDGAPSWGPLPWIALHLTHELRRHCWLYVHHDAVRGLLERTAEIWPVLVESARRRFSIAAITQVLRLLIAEGVSIRNFRAILQCLCDYDCIVADQHELIVFDDRLAVPRALADDEHDRADHVAAFVRSGLKRQISHQHTRGGNTLAVFLLDRSIEQAYAGGAPRPAIEERLLRGLRAELDAQARDAPPPAILTTADVRPHLRAAIADEFPEVHVLAYSELSPELNIQPIARLE